MMKMMKNFEEVYRLQYNLVVSISKEVGYDDKLNFKSLRKTYFTDKSIKDSNISNEKKNKLLLLPSTIREYAIKEAVTAHNNICDKVKKRIGLSRYKIEKRIEKLNENADKNILKLMELREDLEMVDQDFIPVLRFKKKTSPRFSMDFHYRAISVMEDKKTLIICPGEFKKYSKSKDFNHCASNECINDTFLTESLKPKHEVKILRTPTGYYLSLVNLNSSRCQLGKKDFVAIDPGIRTFATTIDSEGIIKEYGKNWYYDMKKDFDDLDYAKHRKDKCYAKTYKKAKLTLLVRRKHSKIVNKIKDMHNKITKSLLDDYKVIYAPKLNSKSILRDGCKEQNRRTLSVSQCKFHDYLSFKGGNRVIKSDEYLTTKTCCRCLNTYKVGDSKIFNCESCNMISDRDVNAAVNILFKNIQLL